MCLSCDSSANGLESDLESTHSGDPISGGPDLDLDSNEAEQQPDAERHACVEDSESDAKAGGLERIIQTTWSGCRSQVDEYESDAEDEDYEENTSPPMTNARHADSEIDSEFEWDGMGKRNGLGMDDLVDEDLERIIAEFSAHFSSSFISIKITNTKF
jgi:hypothetical protein